MNDVAPRYPGDNMPPPEPVKLASDRVTALVENAEKWAERVPVINSEELADACNDFLTQLDKQWQEFDAARAAEKKPFDDEAAAVQAKWKPLLERLNLCKIAIAPLHRAWLKLKQQRLDDERHDRERAAAEAQRRADQLAEQAKTGGPGTVTRLIAATEAAGAAEAARQEVRRVPPRAQSRGLYGGRTRSLRTTWYASVVDDELCYRHFRQRSEVKELLQRLANEAARSGVRNPDLPGCWIYSEES
jgi:hypothetical protein